MNISDFYIILLSRMDEPLIIIGMRTLIKLRNDFITIGLNELSKYILFEPARIVIEYLFFSIESISEKIISIITIGRPIGWYVELDDKKITLDILWKEYNHSWCSPHSTHDLNSLHEVKISIYDTSYIVNLMIDTVLGLILYGDVDADGLCDYIANIALIRQPDKTKSMHKLWIRQSLLEIRAKIIETSE